MIVIKAVIYYKLGYPYYRISIHDDHRILSKDTDIAKIMGIPYEDYKDSLIKFNGSDGNEVWFNNNDDILKAIEWVDSVLLAKKLARGVKDG